MGKWAMAYIIGPPGRVQCVRLVWIHTDLARPTLQQVGNAFRHNLEEMEMGQKYWTMKMRVQTSKSSKMVVLICLIKYTFQYGLDRTGIGSKLFNPTIITICGSLGTSLFDPWSTSYWHISVGFISSSHCIFDSESGAVKPSYWVIERNQLFNPFSLISNM